MVDFFAWAEFLTNPFTLFGFIVVVVTGLAKIVLSQGNRLSGAAQERLAARVISAGLVLGVMGMIAGTISSISGPLPPSIETNSQMQPTGGEAQDGDQRTLVDSGGEDANGANTSLPSEEELLSKDTSGNSVKVKDSPCGVVIVGSNISVGSVEPCE